VKPGDGRGSKEDKDTQKLNKDEANANQKDGKPAYRHVHKILLFTTTCSALINLLSVSNRLIKAGQVHCFSMQVVMKKYFS